MAEVIDIDEVGNTDELTPIDESTQQPPSAAPAPTPTPAPAEDDLPEKYRGKSIQQLMQMHQEAERFIGRQAQEVGEVRQLADTLLRNQSKPKPDEVKKEVDFFENPAEAVRQAIESNPVVISANEQARELRKAESQRQLIGTHPDVGQIVSNPEFAEWVTKSNFRKELFRKAENYDFEAANELLGTWKQLNGSGKPAPSPAPAPTPAATESEADKLARQNSLNAAAVDTGGSGEITRKIYRRADLIRLKINNLAKYDAMQDEIDAAYQEGRVR